MKNAFKEFGHSGLVYQGKKNSLFSSKLLSHFSNELELQPLLTFFLSALLLIHFTAVLLLLSQALHTRVSKRELVQVGCVTNNEL